MNAHLHRIVFNAARGMRMVVQETAKSAGKATGATAAVAVAALASMLVPIAASAQIAGAMNVPNTLRPTVLVAPNGVPLVNIQTPSAAGVSRNVYNQFDVGTNGVILNNSRTTAQTQLGGYVQGNPYLATGPARIILNEINSGNPSQLRGYVEVGGSRAEVIIANPAGISVDGGGFINASRATLTTGTPQLNALGGLDSFLVKGGTISIDGGGLDLSTTDYAAILARAVNVNAAIYATDLKVVTGANQISADHSQITPVAGTGAASTFALDVAALGGMYAGKIVLVGTEAGLGVRNAGNIGASAGSLIVTAAGRLENTGTLEGQSVQLTTPGDIDNRGGTIRQTSSASLAITAPTLSNTNGGWIGTEPVPVAAEGGTITAGTGGTSTGGTSTGTTSTGTSTPTGTSTSTATAYVPPSPGVITAGGSVLSDGGKIYAGGPITLQTQNLVNNGGTLSVASMALNQPSFSNQGGTLNVSGALTANVGTFDNSTGTLHAGNLNINTSGDLLNVDGTLTSDSDASLTVGGKIDNTRGTISAAGALTVNVTGAVNNTTGKLASNQNLTLASQSLNNSQGTISSANGNVQLTVAQQTLNTDGHIGSGANVTLQTGSLDGTNGNLQAAGDLNVTAAQALTSTGTNIAGGNATLQGASVDLSGSQTGAANIAVTATQGNVTTSGATVATPGTLAVTANSQPAQTLVNSAGTLNAGQLQIKVSNIANTNGGEIVQTGAGATALVVSGGIDNSNGHIATNGQDLTLQAASITNTSGKIEHAGTGTLTIAGGSFSGANGAITGNGALAVNVTGAFNQDGGNTYAQQIDITTGSLSNQSGGSIVQGGTGTTTLNVAGALNNNAGTLASAGDLSATAGALSNQSGKVQAAGTSALQITVANQLDNSAGGQILAGGNTTVQAGSLINDNGGKITAVGDLVATVGGAASNQGGTIAANGNTTLSAASFNNNGGTTAAVEGDLKVITTGATTNVGGTLQAGGATTLSNAGLDSTSGKIYGQTIGLDSHGQQFTNSQGTLAATNTVDLQTGALVNAAGLIQSGGALTLNAGAVSNNAGVIGAKDALVASTQGFSNTGGGLVLGQADVSINTNGATYDNTDGQTQAVGALTVTAGGVQNASGLIRADTTTVNAGTLVNASTSGANQGIEGTNVALNVGNLNNQAGAVRADQNVTVTSGGTVDNSAGGLLSAGDTLKVVDPNAANPAAKTLNLINTNGTLVANNSVQIDAATFSGDGTLVSGKDLSLALTQDIVNNAKVIANGNLSYGTTGNLTNNGQLIAGDTLTVSGNAVTNTANAEMSGTNTTVNAGTLTNRGLIDSQSLTRINASQVNNVGSGRIYGDHVAIATGTLTNDTETVNGVTQAGTIAARQRLDIAASTITNREHALIFSGGDMGIGGSLDANSVAVGSGGTLNNLSARIESLGNMSVAMGSINNFDTHVQLGPQVTTTKLLTTIAPIGAGKMYTMDEVVVVAGQPFVWARNPDGSTGALLFSGGYGIWNTTFTTKTDTAVNADPAAIVSGGDMTLNGAVVNKDSKIIAGGTLTAGNVTNLALQGNYQTTSLALVVNDKGQTQPLVTGPTQAGTTNVGAFEYVDHVNGTVGAGIGAASGGTANANGGGAGTANGGNHPGTIVEVAANVGTVVGGTGSSAGGATGTSTGSGATVPTVVRTSTPTLTLPQASLYRTNAGNSRYLIETDPRFANYRQWLSSDYLLNNLGLDPNNTLKRLGDGFYEQQLINQQIAQLTGYRYVDGYNNDQDQYTALMSNGVTFAKKYGLTVGVALTAVQMAQLTSDIVWLVEQTVTLPDGSTQRVLVPQVYVRVRPGDIDGSGALLSADATLIKATGDLVNTGTIAGRSLVSINAENVNNLSGGRIAGGSIGINARNDINNIGASITAADAAVLTAGRDINIRTTTGSGSAGNRNIDRVAGVYVSNPDGVLIASAGRDVSLVAGILSSAGSVAVGAGRNINLGTVTESGTGSSSGQGTTGNVSVSREVGSVIQGSGNVRLAAGNDLNIRASAVQSNDGALVATAKNDINITAGQATSSVTTSSVHSSGGVMRKTTTSTFDSSSTTDVLSSSLSGKTVALVAGNDINAQAAQLSSQDAMSLSAGRDINFTTATASSTDLHASQTRTNSTGLGRAWAVASDAGGPVGGYGNRNSSGNSTSVDIRTQAIGTTVSAGSLQTVSGRDTTLTGAAVVADSDITMVAGRNLTLQSAQNTEFSSSSSANSKSGFIGSWSSPGLGHIKDFQAQNDTSTTQQASQVASLNGNVTLVAGNDYRQTASSVIAQGNAGTLAGGDVNILAKNVTIEAAYNTGQSNSYQRSESTKLGGSASFMGVSTDSLQGAKNTIKAMGDTKGDSRMQALGAVNLAMSGKQAYDAASSLASGAAGGNFTYGVSVSLGHNNAQGSSITHSSTAVGSSVMGANNVNIVATGGGQSSNIHAVGSTISAGNTVNLAADNNITLEAAKSTSQTAGKNNSSGENVGVTFGGGAQTGFSIQLGVQTGKGSNNQNETSYTATNVTGGKAVNISAGGDLTMRGATVEANRVTADVGGDLNIETLRDVSVGNTKQSSGGFGVSLCIPPICYGAVATVSANAASAKANGLTVSPSTQSGIKAGDGGFDVNVKGNTNLTGGVISSTQAAIDNNRNNFETGGTLTMTDLQNVNQSKGSSYSVGGSLSLGYTTAADANPSLNPKPGQQATPPGGSPGIGSYNGGTQTSTTRSGISGIAGDQTVRTGDTSSAGTLTKNWNTQQIVTNVQAQAQLTQDYFRNSAKEIGTYAGKQAADLRAQAKTETDPGKQQALLNEASQWDEGGSYRVALHTAAGALGGGVGGALGAGGSAALMPRIGQAIADMGLPTPVAQALGAVTAAAIGGIVGGGAGAASAYSVDINNRQLHPQERAWLAQNRSRVAQEARASYPAAFVGLDDATVLKLVDQMAIVKLDDQATQSVLARYKGTSFEPAMGAIVNAIRSDTQNMVFVDSSSGETLRMFTNTVVTRGGDVSNSFYYYDSSKFSQYLPTTAKGIADFSNTYGYAPPLTNEQVAGLDPQARAALGTAVTAQGIREQGGVFGAISNIVQTIGQVGVAGLAGVGGGGAASRGPGGPVDALNNLGDSTVPFQPPKVTVNSQGMTEIVPTATPTARQAALNTADIGGGGGLRPAEAAVAAQLEPVTGTVQRYEGPPTNGTKKPDFVVTSGSDAGKTVDMMYTTGGLRRAEIDGMNKFFAKNMTVPSVPGEQPPGIQQIQSHFAKAETVVMDFRTLTPQNQQVLTNYLNTLPPAQAARVVIIK